MSRFLRSALSLLLIMGLMLSLVPATAASSSLSNEVPMENGKVKEVRLTRLQDEVVLITTIKATQSGVLSLKVMDYNNSKAVIQSETVPVSNGQTLEWKLSFDTNLPFEKNNIKHLVYEFTMDGKSYTYSLYLTYDSQTDTILVEKGTWYSNNTACSFGLPLRDMSHPKTDKWYHVTPVDLSIQGEQEFLYIASNLYIIGKVIVTVSGDYVFVNYYNYYTQQGGNTETLDEFMTLFHDMNEVTVNPAQAARSFNFGQPISITNDLDGDTNVLLFVLNHVTYRDYVTGTHKLTRYWHNLPEYKALRTQMELLMDQP